MITSSRAMRDGAVKLMHAAVTGQLRLRQTGDWKYRLFVHHGEVMSSEELDPAGPRHAQRPLKTDGRSRRERRSSDHTPVGMELQESSGEGDM